jgi:segregation and condensation protein B
MECYNAAMTESVDEKTSAMDAAAGPEVSQATPDPGGEAPVKGEGEAASQADAETADGGKENGRGRKAKAPIKQVEPGLLALQVEALLMTTDRALPTSKIAELLGNVAVKAVNDAIAALNEVYEQTQRSFRIEQLAGGWQVLTLPAHAEVLTALHRSRSNAKLGPAAMETLAIIAYQQPILRAQVEAIRGVACGETIRALMERRLVKIVGRAEEIGRPMLYGTTRTFLEVFGLATLKDLPKVEELKLKATP